MKNVFKLTNKYIILVTVLILYSLITNVYAVFFAISGGIKIINLIIALIILIMMTAAFIAGWFKMIKAAILEQDKDEPNSLIKLFPEGVGEYFLPTLGMLLQIMIIFLIIGGIALAAGIHFIGNPEVSRQAMLEASHDMNSMQTFLSSLSQEQLLKLSAWNNLFMLTFMCAYLSVFLYLPAIFFKNKNPFIAYFISLKNLFGRIFFKTLGVFFLILFANVFLSVMSVICGSNAIAGFCITLASFYVFTASAVGLFEYYNHNFTDSHLGQNIDVKI